MTVNVFVHVDSIINFWTWCYYFAPCTASNSRCNRTHSADMKSPCRLICSIGLELDVSCPPPPPPPPPHTPTSVQISPDSHLNLIIFVMPKPQFDLVCYEVDPKRIECGSTFKTLLMYIVLSSLGVESCTI